MANHRAGLMGALVAVALVGPSMASDRLKSVCGVRQGSAGNAWLQDKTGKTTVVLATQGGDQRLLDEADDRLHGPPGGEPGTQVGRPYCLLVDYDPAGRPVRVLRARPDGRAR